jgi:hypothetical protein
VNTGRAPLDNPKLEIRVSGAISEIGNENTINQYHSQDVKTDITIYENKAKIFIDPTRTAFTPGEEYVTGLIYIKPTTSGGDIQLAWRFVSNRFSEKGILNIQAKTFLIPKDVIEHVEFRQHVGVLKTITDYLE